VCVCVVWCGVCEWCVCVVCVVCGVSVCVCEWCVLRSCFSVVTATKFEWNASMEYRRNDN